VNTIEAPSWYDTKHKYQIYEYVSHKASTAMLEGV